MKLIFFCLISIVVVCQNPLYPIISCTLLSRENKPTLLLLGTSEGERQNYVETHHELLSIHLDITPHDNIDIVYELDEYKLKYYEENKHFQSPHYIHLPIMMLTQYMFANIEHQKFNWHPCEKRAPFISRFINYLGNLIDAKITDQLSNNYTVHTLSHYLAGSLNRMNSFIAKTQRTSLRNQYLLSMKEKMLEHAFAIEKIVHFARKDRFLSLAIGHLNPKNLQNLLNLIIVFDNYIVSTAYADFMLDTLAPLTNKKVVIMLRQEYIDHLLPILQLSRFEKKYIENDQSSFLSLFENSLSNFFA